MLVNTYCELVNFSYMFLNIFRKLFFWNNLILLN